jgi:hypothetical protein
MQDTFASSLRRCGIHLRSSVRAYPPPPACVVSGFEELINRVVTNNKQPSLGRPLDSLPHFGTTDNTLLLLLLLLLLLYIIIHSNTHVPVLLPVLLRPVPSSSSYPALLYPMMLWQL